MASFVRFVFTILIVGMLVNLAVVVLANANSQRVQDIQYRDHAARFVDLVADVGGHIRRADVIVEKQLVDSKDQVIESTLLLRQYQDTGSHQSHPLRVVRIVIPGDRLQAGGALLDFDKDFTGPKGEYKMLAGNQIALFDKFCGAGETAPANPTLPDERFTFFPRDRVPELLRLNPSLPQASFFELKLWQYIWSQIPEMPRLANLPWVAPGTVHLRATWLAPVVKTVRRGHTYTAFIGADGISLSEDEASTTDLIQSILEQARKLDTPDEP